MLCGKLGRRRPGVDLVDEGHLDLVATHGLHGSGVRGHPRPVLRIGRVHAQRKQVRQRVDR